MTATPTIGVLCFPPEVRMEIYEYVFVGRWSYTTRISRGRSPTKVSISNSRVEMKPPKGWLALIQTCRLVRAEAAPIAYRQNEFVFSDVMQQGDVLGLFINAIGPANADLLSRVTIDFPDPKHVRTAKERVAIANPWTADRLRPRNRRLHILCEESSVPHCNGLQTLQQLRMHYHGIRELVLCVVSKQDWGLRFNDTNDRGRRSRAALEKIADVVRAMPTVQTINIKFMNIDCMPSSTETDIFEGFGWNVYKRRLHSNWSCQGPMPLNGAKRKVKR